MAESNAIGEEAGRKIAEEMMEIGPMAWLSENISAIWIITILLSLIPVIWFYLATYYKRVSALYVNKILVFSVLVFLLLALDVIGIFSNNSSVPLICFFIDLGIFAYLVFSDNLVDRVVKKIKKELKKNNLENLSLIHI